MAEFKNDELGYSFEVADKPKVYDQMRYWSAIQRTGDKSDLFQRYWEAARELVQGWACDVLALDADLEKIDDPRATAIIMKVGMAVYTHIVTLEAVPKNS